MALQAPRPSDARPIVVGYDGTDGAPRPRSAEAVRLAGPLGAEIVARVRIHAEPAWAARWPTWPPCCASAAGRVTGEALQRRGRRASRARGELVDGRPADVLAAGRRAEGAQMIVVGSYGEGPLKSFVLGGTAHRIAHVTTVPVLIVRPQR